MRKLALMVLLIVLISLPVYAEIGGYVSVDYDTMNKDWHWTLSVDKHITSWWLVGASMVTYAPSYTYKHFIPAWVPHRLDYEVYAEVHYKNVSLRVTSWCDHWFSQSYNYDGDSHGLTLRLKYEF
jgi:hypothetical protein